MAQILPGPDSPELCMVEIVGRDGVLHHVGPFKNRDAAEAWIAQNAPHSSADDAKTGERKLTSI